MIFFNFKKNNWIKFLLVAEFVYNNTKNASTSHISLELSCNYYFYITYKKTLIFFEIQFNKWITNKAMEADNYLYKNFYYTQNFQK